MKILLTDCATVSTGGDLPLTVFREFGDAVYYDSITREELLREVADTEVILTNKIPVDRAVIEAAPKLRYIGLFATGYNIIDTAFARERGVTVCNAGSYSTAAVAQQVFAYLLAHFSAVEGYNRQVAAGDWIRSPIFSMLTIPTDELAGKTIGIIGYGSIGRAVARIARAFEMRVVVHTRTPKDDPEVEFLSFDALLRESDIVTVHCPLTAENADLFDAAAFSKMRQGAYFINTARGGLVVEQALRDALESHHLAGAAVDVLRQEPMAPDCPLLGAPNLIITPHTAWAPFTTRRRLVDLVVRNLRAFLDGRPQNVVN